MSGEPERRTTGQRGPLGDEAELFSSFNGYLVRAVQRNTNTSPDIVDDACAFAWQQFMRYQPDRERNWRSWMITTAEREAWRLHRAEAGHVSFTMADEAGERFEWEPIDDRDHAGIRVRLREALQALAKVPDRRRQVKVLQVTGFSYDEIGSMLGLTYTRVNRLMVEANTVLKEEEGRAAVAGRPRSLPPRAARLEELERESPRWLLAAVGTRPGATADPGALLAWRRAALAIDDYRRQHGHRLSDEPLGERPADREAARPFDLASAAISRAREARSKERRLGLDR